MAALTVLPPVEALRGLADDPDLLDLLDAPPEGRSFYLLQRTRDLELWLLAWAPGASTGWHDHGSAGGAHTVLAGTLEERTFQRGVQVADVNAGDARSHAAGQVHDIRNPGPGPALSLHAYSPRLDAMNHYRLSGDRLVLVGAEPGR